MLQSNALDTTTALPGDSANVAPSRSALPVIDLEATGMPIPSLEEFLRQATVLYEAVTAARPLLDLNPAEVASAQGADLADTLELATAGKNWADALWNIFGTIEDHMKWAAVDRAP